MAKRIEVKIATPDGLEVVTGYESAVPGLVVNRRLLGDGKVDGWNITHAPSGLTINGAHFPIATRARALEACDQIAAANITLRWDGDSGKTATREHANAAFQAGVR